MQAGLFHTVLGAIVLRQHTAVLLVERGVGRRRCRVFWIGFGFCCCGHGFCRLGFYHGHSDVIPTFLMTLPHFARSLRLIAAISLPIMLAAPAPAGPDFCCGEIIDNECSTQQKLCYAWRKRRNLCVWP